MNCNECRDHMMEYAEKLLPLAMTEVMCEHLKDCEDCADEYLFWQDTSELIQASMEEVDLAFEQRSIAADVMNRIHVEHRWSAPRLKMSFWNTQFRNRFVLVSSLCLIFFSVFFTIHLTKASDEAANIQAVTGSSGVQVAMMAEPDVITASIDDGTATASISAPIPYVEDHSLKHPLIALALFGLILSTLTIGFALRAETRTA